MTPTATPEQSAPPAEELVQLDPALVIAAENSRYNLKRNRIDSLKASILAEGVVLQPVEVEDMGDGKYHLTSGFYRHAAVMELNKEGAGLTLPAIVRPVDALTRLKHQLAENMERENQSPMDKAIAIKRLMDAGVSRVEIRQMFASAGGRKGNQVQPLSNAMMNILLNLLTLPKAIQEKIHDGRVGIEAAYLLGKVPPERRAAVLEQAEAERLRQIEQEERDEEKFLSAERKVVEVESKVKEALSAVDTAKQEVENSLKLIDEKTRALRSIQAEPYLELDAAGKKLYTERLKAAEQDVKGAEKVARDAKNGLARVLKQKTSVEELAEKQRERLEQARNAKKKTAKKSAEAPIGGKEVKEAAKKVGTSAGYVPLSVGDIRQTVKDLMKETVPAKVQLIGQAIAQCFNGVTTTKQLIDDLAVITGEKAAPVHPKAAPVPATPARRAVDKAPAAPAPAP